MYLLKLIMTYMTNWREGEHCSTIVYNMQFWQGTDVSCGHVFCLHGWCIKTEGT